MNILLAKGYTNYGIEDVAVSVPCIIGQDGIERGLKIPLIPKERKKLKDSAESLKAIIKEVKEL